MRTSFSVIFLTLFSSFTGLAQTESGGNDHLEMARGFDVDNAFSVEQLDAVNTLNGNLVLTVPLGSRFQVGTFDYGFSLVYNSKAWEFYNRCDDQGDCADLAVPYPFSNAGMGWQLSFGELFEPRGADLDPNLPWPNHSNQHWLYIAPDGSRHQIGIDPRRDDGFLYSRGGRHVRAKYAAGTHAETMTIELPDGQIHEFRRTNWNDCLAQDRCWKLVEMRDLFDNTVTFTYTGSGSGTQIDIADSFGRQHRVAFESSGATNDIGSYLVRINQITLNQHMGPQAMTFELDYSPTGTSTTYLIRREYPHAWGGSSMTKIRVPLLHLITLPDQSRYTFEYNLNETVSNPYDSGILTAYTLPTMGRVDFEYGELELPKPCDFVSDQNGIGGVPRHDDPERYQLRRVATRTQTDPFGENATTSYEAEAENRYQGGSNCRRPRWHKATVLAPAGTDGRRLKTETWTSIAREDEGNYRASEYGLPMRKLDSSDKKRSPFSGKDLFLSTRVWDCSGSSCGSAIRETYVRYAVRTEDTEGFCESGDSAQCTSVDSQLVETMTLYLDDDRNGSVYKGMVYGDYDGLGHMRSVTHYSGGFSGNSEPRVEQTMFNPHINPNGSTTHVNVSNGEIEVKNAFFNQLPSPHQPWLLNLFDRRTITGRGPNLETIYCRNSEGQVLKETVKPGVGTSENLVTQYRYNGKGQVYEEGMYFSNSVGCGQHSNPSTRMTHGYDPTYGHRETTSHFGFTEKELDLDVDGRGLTVSSKDSAGVQTSTVFDLLNRPTNITTDAGADPISFVYSSASASRSAKVDISQGDTAITVHFDGFGRPYQEIQSLPGNQTQTTTLTRDSLGRVIQVDINGQMESREYDVLGRPTLIAEIGGKRTTYDYVGERQVTKNEGDVRTVVDRDAYGRVASRLFPNVGGDVHTSYCDHFDYDLANRMTLARRQPHSCSSSVPSQERTWQYDGRGFLLEEKTTEQGTFTYSHHDVFGQPGKLANAAYHNTTWEYDAKGRLTKMLDNGQFLIYRRYATSACQGNNRCLGKLLEASRFNHLGNDQYEVRQSFRYEGTDGALSEISTYVEYPDPSGTRKTQSFTQSMATDGQGRVTDHHYPDCNDCGQPISRTVSNSYSRGLLTGVQAGANDGISATFQYNDFGFMTQVQFAGFSGAKTEYEPDYTGNRIGRIKVDHGSVNYWDSGNYRYNTSGFITGIGASTGFGYDGIGRLHLAETFTPGGDLFTQVFRYDWYGNPTFKRTANGGDVLDQVFVLDEETNRLLFEYESAFFYDQLGRLYQDECFDYRYDADGMITEMTPRSNAPDHCDSLTLKHLYDADGYRLLTMCDGCPEPAPVAPGAGGGPNDNPGEGGTGGGTGGSEDPNFSVTHQDQPVLEGSTFSFGEQSIGFVEKTFTATNTSSVPFEIFQPECQIIRNSWNRTPDYLIQMQEKVVHPGESLTFKITRLDRPYRTDAEVVIRYRNPTSGYVWGDFKFQIEGGEGEGPDLFNCFGDYPAIPNTRCGRSGILCWLHLIREGGDSGPGDGTRALRSHGTLELGSVPLGDTKQIRFQFGLSHSDSCPSQHNLKLTVDTDSDGFFAQVLTRPTIQQPGEVLVSFHAFQPGFHKGYLRGFYTYGPDRDEDGEGDYRGWFGVFVSATGGEAPILRVNDAHGRWMERLEHTDFGNHHVSANIPVRRFRIANPGLATLRNVSVSLEQASDGPFEIVQQPGSTVAPGQDTAFAIKINRPSPVIGTMDCVINIHHDAENMPNPMQLMARVRLYVHKQTIAFGETVPELPNRIEAEHFNRGDQGWAYHDRDPANRLFPNYRRDTGVDVGTPHQHTVIGNIEAGEWFEYQVLVPNSGIYELSAAYASLDDPFNNDGALTLSSANQSTSATLPDTGLGAQQIRIAQGGRLFLEAGEQTLRLTMDQPGFYLDWFELTAAGDPMHVSAETPVGPIVSAGSTWDLGSTDNGQPLSTSFFVHNNNPTASMSLTQVDLPGADWLLETEVPVQIPPSSYAELRVTRLAQHIGTETQSLSLSTQHGAFSFFVRAQVEDVHSQRPYNGQAWAIPSNGVIRAWKYDLGRHGEGHFDLSEGNSGDFTRPNGASDWVDLSGHPEYGPLVAQPQHGEWLAFTVDIAQAAFYDLQLLRLAQSSAQESLGRVDFFLDENPTPFTSVDLGSGNAGLLHITAGNLFLPQGVHVLKLQFNQPRSDLALVWFKLIDAVNPPSDPLIATDDSFQVIQGSTLTQFKSRLLANDIGGGRFSAFLDQPPTHTGTFTTNPHGFSFEPAAGFTGFTSFHYRISRQNEVADATVTIEVLSPGSGPTPVDDRLLVPATQSTSIGGHFLLANDRGQDPLVYDMTRQPAHGSGHISVTGHAYYQPTAGYSGQDSFDYNIIEDQGSGPVSATSATVFLTVVAAPVAHPDGVFETAFNTPLTLSFDALLANDEPHPAPVDIKHFTFANETLWQVDPQTRTLTYTPPQGFSGQVQFGYRSEDRFEVSDVRQESNLATVTVAVLGPPLIAQDDRLLATPEDPNPMRIPLQWLLANDASEYALDITAFSQPKFATLTRDGDDLLLLPNRVNWTQAEDQFTYTVTTPFGYTDQATVQIELDASCEVQIQDDFETDLELWSRLVERKGWLELEPQAAMEGDLGLAIHLPTAQDRNVYAELGPLNRDTHYRTTFRINPNDLIMAEHDSFPILVGTQNGNGAFQVLLSRVNGTYRLTATALLDDQSPIVLPAILAGENEQTLTLEWWAADHPGANNGGLRFWRDHVLVGERLDLDNDSKEIAFLRLGAVFGVDPGTRGSLYFDQFTSCQGTRNRHFWQYADFEDHGLANWQAAVGDTQTATSASLAGSAGLVTSVTQPATDLAYVSRRDLPPQSQFSSEWLFDPNDLDIPIGHSVIIASATGGGKGIWQVHLRKKAAGNDYELQLRANQSVDVWESSPWLPLANQPMRILVDWLASANSYEDDGFALLSVEPLLGTGITPVSHLLDHLENHILRVEHTHLGLLWNLPSGTDGSIYFDTVKFWSVLP